MTKEQIYARLDKIAGKLQDLDFLHEFTPAQQALHDSLSGEYDMLVIELNELTAA